MAYDSWDLTEVLESIRGYFELFKIELSGKPINKSEFLRQLNKKITKRSIGSISKKFSNISAVLQIRGLRFLKGYTPLHNFQNLLESEVDSYFETNPNMRNLLENHSMIYQPLKQLDKSQLADYLVQSPDPHILKEYTVARLKKIDYAARDFQNRQLGKKGEEFIYIYEKASLEKAGLDKLASKVKWVSQEEGDGAGFDILSFEKTGKEKYIEVKTTNLDIATNFYMSKNELDFSKKHDDDFSLCRVYDFSDIRRFYTANTKTLMQFDIKPFQFMVSPKPEHIAGL